VRKFIKFLKPLIKVHKLFLLFTLFYVVFSFLTYKDYGITFDEKVEYDAGAYLVKYYLTPTSQQYVNEMVNHGPINIETRHLPLFSVYSRIYTMVLSLINFKFYFEWFHLLNLLFGYLLFLFSYLFFTQSRYKPNRAVLAPVMLFLSPYVLGHIPANPKDIPFAWAYLGSLYFIHFFGIKKYDFRIKTLVLGIVFGITISLRAVGLTLLVISFVYDLIYQKKTFFQTITDSLFITITSFLIWIIAMPWLGSNFYANFINAVFNATAYSEWKGTLFYLGNFITKYEIPWHYLFVLLLVKVTLPVLIFFFLGSYVFIKQLVKKVKPGSMEALLFGAIYFNLLIYLVTKPVVYNGIRHFLYLVVLVVLFSTIYLVKLLDLNKGRRAVSALVGLYLVFTAYRMVILHPYEYVYFNELTLGLRGAQYSFQMDYWGASYKEASEYAINLAQKNNLSDLKVFSCDSRFAVDYYSKFIFHLVGAPREADIIFCDNFRDDIRNLSQPVIHTINREGVPLLYIRAQPWFYSRYKDFSYK
jgi:hypothetical protein